MTCARTAPDNRVAAWDRNSLFLKVPNIFTDKGKMQNVKCKSQKERKRFGLIVNNDFGFQPASESKKIVSSRQ